MKEMKINLKATGVLLLTAVLMISCNTAMQKKAGAGENRMHPPVDFSINCMDCHQDITPDITAEWAESGHGKLNYGCYICHGDGEETFTVSPASDNCISCHSASMDHLNDVAGKSCFSCHNGHSLLAE